MTTYEERWGATVREISGITLSEIDVLLDIFSMLSNVPQDADAEYEAGLRDAGTRKLQWMKSRLSNLIKEGMR